MCDDEGDWKVFDLCVEGATFPFLVTVLTYFFFLSLVLKGAWYVRFGGICLCVRGITFPLLVTVLTQFFYSSFVLKGVWYARFGGIWCAHCKPFTGGRAEGVNASHLLNHTYTTGHMQAPS